MCPIHCFLEGTAVTTLWDMMSRAPTRRAGLCPSTVCTHRPGERCQRCSGSRLRVLNLGARRSLQTPAECPFTSSKNAQGVEQRGAQAPAQGFPNNPHTLHPLHGRSGTPRTRDTPKPPSGPRHRPNSFTAPSRQPQPSPRTLRPFWNPQAPRNPPGRPNGPRADPPAPPFWAPTAPRPRARLPPPQGPLSLTARP